MQSILQPVLIVYNLFLNVYAIINLGKGMSYIPGAASLAATHRGKVKNIRLTTLRDANQNMDHHTCILDFEKETIAFDKKQRQQCADGREHFIKYASLGHPYIKDYSLTASLNWVLLMNPLMIDLLSRADFIEVDVTYKASVQFEYLLNAVTFNYTTMRCKSHNIMSIVCNYYFTEPYFQASSCMNFCYLCSPTSIMATMANKVITVCDTHGPYQSL